MTVEQVPVATDALRRRLDDPAVAASLSAILDHADLLAVLVEGLDGFVSRSEVIGASIAASLTDARALADAPDSPLAGLDVRELADALRTLATTVPRLTPAVAKVVDSGLVETLLDSGITEPAVIDQVGRLGRGLAHGAEAARTAPVEVAGPMSLLRVLKDPDVARGLSFFLSVLRSMGAELGTAPVESRRQRR